MRMANTASQKLTRKYLPICFGSSFMYRKAAECAATVNSEKVVAFKE